MLRFECIKNEKSVYFLLTSAPGTEIRRICTTSGHHGLQQLYMPNHPNV